MDLPILIAKQDYYKCMDTSFMVPHYGIYDKPMERLCTTLNIAVQKLYDLPKMLHHKLLAPISNLCHVDFALKKRFFRFMFSCLISKNNAVKYICKWYITNNLSLIGLIVCRTNTEYMFSTQSVSNIKSIIIKNVYCS